MRMGKALQKLRDYVNQVENGSTLMRIYEKQKLVDDAIAEVVADALLESESSVPGDWEPPTKAELQKFIDAADEFIKEMKKSRKLTGTPIDTPFTAEEKRLMFEYWAKARFK
jgi:hypothetical protein